MTTLCPHRSDVRPGRDRSGFTLVELLVVVVILVILVGILVPTLSGARNASRRATSQAMMQTVLSACSSFRADKQRQPGAFSVNQIGSSSNDPTRNGGYGLTSMQNVMLDLMGGIVARGDNSVQPPNTGAGTSWLAVIIFQQGFNAATGMGDRDKAYIDPRKMGSPDGPQYLNPPKELFTPCDGKVNNRKLFNAAREAAADPNGNPPSTNERVGSIPDLLDPWGMPYLMWTQDPLAVPEDPFSRISANNTAIVPERAKFYWLGNASMLASSRLGKAQINQTARSYLGRNGNTGATIGGGGGPNSGASADGDIVKSMEALLGNPSFPIIKPATGPIGAFNTNPIPSQYFAQVGIAGNQPASKYPGQALGELIMHSAAQDATYLAKRGSFLRATYDDSPTALREGLPIDDFDDLTLGGGN